MNIENKKIGGHLLADQLNINGVDTIFCVPGESYLGLLDGLYSHSNQIKLITTRHESGAANMADAYAKLTNKPRYFAKRSEIEQTNFKFIKNNEKQQKLLQQKEHYLKHIH